MTVEATESARLEPALTLTAFEAADIEPDAFNHELHVYAGWKMLGECALETALARYSAALKRITEKFGAANKYHETVTWFFLLTIAERRSRSNASGWAEFRAANEDLFMDARQMLARHYSDERLKGTLAKRQFLLPDIAPIATAAPAVDSTLTAS